MAYAYTLYIHTSHTTMMNNQERLEQLLRHINELEQLTNSIRGTEIYPVSFFSRAFDLTGKMQIDLHEIEMGQIELFDQQLREHQAQLRAIERTQRPAYDAAATTHRPEEAPTEEPLMKPAPQTAARPQPAPAPKPQPAPTLKPQPAPASTSHAEASLNDAIERTKLIDLRKAFTLNDRFRFCRELFGRNEERMNEMLNMLNEARSYEESLKLLHAHVQWDFESETATDFLNFIERRFV